MNNKNEKYGLFTATTMIIGICIGSGIFFKSDNILKATGGSIFLGSLVFIIAAFAIIFGGLCFGELASRTSTPGGIVTYFDEFGSKKAACSCGWFQTLVYFPSLVSVVSWVIGVYVCILFNLGGSLEQQIFIGSSFMILCFIYNTISPKFGGAFQNISTLIKIIPLALIGVLGLIYGDPIAGLKTVSTPAVVGASWIAAIGPIAFSFDGWTISTSIAHEVRDSKKNMPLALIIAPIFILIAYLVYFIGVSSFVGAENVMALGDAHVAVAAENLLGATFAKSITIFVVISVMGTVNGLILGYIRMPHSMALRGNMFPFSKQLLKTDNSLHMSVNSSIFAFIVCIFWVTANYITQKFNVLPNSDVSEIPIAVSYLLSMFLYLQVFKLYRQGEITSKFRGVVSPALASLGALFIVSGGVQGIRFFVYIILCLLLIVVSQVYYNTHNKKI